ncbi:MAG: response regulator transcription factor [Candidatus Melainabacteria bacterium]|jgi:DNA-binding response OmpR family regulator|nr:response regulator transcription factor [Candidatus Melainabacteria bacterium]
MARILVADDDKQLCGLIEDWLIHQKYTVDITYNGGDAQEMLKTYEYDCIILDWDMPEVTGIDVCKTFRTNGGETPVLMLTGKSSIDSKEIGFDSGADDYLTKPVELRELSARIRALLRRKPTQQLTILNAGNLYLDPAKRTVTKNGKEIELWPIEFALLEFLMMHPDQIFNADALLHQVWKSEASAGPEAVRTTIKRLRRRIDDDSKNSLIKNVYGFGYKLSTKDE